MIKAILAIDDNNAIGFNGNLPWPHIPEDLKNFQKLTTNQRVIMGRKTWESLPNKFRPLPNRYNYVVTSSDINNTHCITLKNVKTFIHWLDENFLEDVWIIGGSKLIDYLVDEIDEFHITRIKEVYIADTYINTNNLLKNFDKISEKSEITSTGTVITFQVWRSSSSNIKIF